MVSIGKMFYFYKSVGRFRRKSLLDISRRFFSTSNVKCAITSDSPPWNIIFYGTDFLSEVTLKALNTNRLSNDKFKIVKNLEVVCIQTDCLVRRYAAKNGLTIHTWPFDVPPDTYDVGVVVSFGHMIPTSSIIACKYGIINAHPSLLPRWRGAAPIFHSILNDDEKTGVTITQVSPNKFDVGNILMQDEYIMPERCTSRLLIEDLSKMAADMILKTLQKLPHYIETSYPQPTEGRTLARKIKPENCRINWNKESALLIDRKFRAFNGFFDLCTMWKGFVNIDILEIVSPKEAEDAKVSDLIKKPSFPGSCYFHKKRKVLFIKCQDGWTGIKFLRIPKRGKITALDFYNGFLSKEDPDKGYFV